MATFLTQCDGRSLVEETIYENRFQNLLEMEKMGAQFKISKNNQKATIKGKTPLVGTTVEATDLRGGAAVVIAGLAAKGKTRVNNIEYILRGYENLDKKLNKIGAEILKMRDIPQTMRNTRE